MTHVSLVTQFLRTARYYEREWERENEERAHARQSQETAESVEVALQLGKKKRPAAVTTTMLYSCDDRERANNTCDLCSKSLGLLAHFPILQ